MKASQKGEERVESDAGLMQEWPSAHGEGELELMATLTRQQLFILVLACVIGAVCLEGLMIARGEDGHAFDGTLAFLAALAGAALGVRGLLKRSS